ncbi:hypothetical protein BC827DRAFT_1155709 [Russula dissimulans]|nr:hypothetical protein BC827DRAFT_1155709 [Russula dissimulans]
MGDANIYALSPFMQYYIMHYEQVYCTSPAISCNCKALRYVRKRIGYLSQLFPPKPCWNAEDVPDHTGKTVIVTGGSGGIVKEIVWPLLSKGDKLYIATHSEEKSLQAIEELNQDAVNDLGFFLKLDLAVFVFVKPSAEEFVRKESQLNMLYKKRYRAVAYMRSSTRTTSADQHHVFKTGTFKLPLPHQIVPLPPHGDGKGLASGVVGTKVDASKPYGQSKLGNILSSNKPAWPCGRESIISISLHPGSIATDLTRTATLFVRTFVSLVMYPVSCGAITSLYAGAAPAAGELSGKVGISASRIARPGEPKTISSL